MMTKPTNNLERLEAIRRGLEKILEKRKGEQERWLKALGGIKETALTDLRLAAGIGQVEGMLREIDTVIKTDYCLCKQSEGYLPSAETARGAGEKRTKVKPGCDVSVMLGLGKGELQESIRKTLAPDSSKAKYVASLAALVATGKLTYQEAVKAARGDCGCGAPECPACSLSTPVETREKMITAPIDIHDAQFDEKLGAMLRRKGMGENEPFTMRIKTGEPSIDEALAGGVKRRKVTRKQLVKNLLGAIPNCFGEKCFAECEQGYKSCPYKTEGSLSEETARAILTGEQPEQPDIMVPLNKREPAPEDIDVSILKTRKPDINIAIDGKAVAEATRKRAPIAYGGTPDCFKDECFKKCSEGFEVCPYRAKRVAAMEALLRMGSGDMARKHTAEDTQAVRAFVRKALELPFYLRDKLFHNLGLIKLSESVDLTELETIKIAFRKARESGRESMETLITEVNKLHAGLKQ